MDPSLTKALIGGGALTALTALLVGLLTAFTSRRANSIAERKLSVEVDTAALDEARKWREEMRAELKAVKEERNAALARADAYRKERDECFHAHALRIRACDACGAPCQVSVKVEPPPPEPTN
jgi:uncharacterized protein (DUF3084 family)